MNTSGRQDLSEGGLGIALLHIQRGETGRARACIAAAVGGGVSAGANASLFHGAPALEFVLRCAGRENAAVAAEVDRIIARRLASARARLRAAAHDGPGLAEFDLIRGLSGLGALLLSRTPPPPLLAELLTYLIDLTARRPDGLPGWWCPAAPQNEPAIGGHSNNGIAHGITGPLALLALAARAGILVEGQLRAIEVCLEWLEEHGRSYWTTREHLTAPRPPAPARPSWCYGALGIARTRQHAALALGDDARGRAAENEALAALEDPHSIGRITDAGLCHGWAGLLTVTTALAADSTDPARFEAARADLERRAHDGLTALHKPGFLEGRAGADLALSGPDTTGWTRALLIN